MGQFLSANTSFALVCMNISKRLITFQNSLQLNWRTQNVQELRIVPIKISYKFNHPVNIFIVKEK